jgi:hypothetical protein
VPFAAVPARRVFVGRRRPGTLRGGAPGVSCSRIFGQWDDYVYEVFDGHRDVGRIFRENAHEELWFWGVSFQLTRRKSYGNVASLDEAKAAFRAEYEAWKGTNDSGSG